MLILAGLVLWFALGLVVAMAFGTAVRRGGWREQHTGGTARQSGLQPDALWTDAVRVGAGRAFVVEIGGHRFVVTARHELPPRHGIATTRDRY